MAAISYTPPTAMNGPKYFGGNIASLDRLRSLLLLCGQGTVHYGTTSISLKNDFMGIPAQTPAPFKIRDVAGKIPGCSHHGLKSLISNSAVKNAAIHQNIFQELLHCLAHYENKSYIASFVHLYRLIENTALYLPLVTVVSKGVNNFTFANYQELIDNKAKADLSVLKKFSLNILDPAVRESVALYSFATTSNPNDNLKVAISLIDPTVITNSGVDFFELKYKYTDRLIIGFRNQFFHYLYHEKNISLKSMKNPDEFLEQCLPHFLVYFSFLYREMLIAEWELWA